MNLKYFSQYYKITITGEEDWFDPNMSLDTLLFIDPFLVFKNNNPLFSKAREKFFDFFRAAFELAHEAIDSRAAYKKLEGFLKFPEVKELCLGFSEKGTSGSGSGGGYSKGFATALVKLAEGGYNEINHFEEIEIFTLGIGKDRISDATANIIKFELIKYTQNVCKQFNIPTSHYLIKNTRFNLEDKLWENGTFSLPKNPFFDKRAVILVPKDLLGAIHAIGSDGFEQYINDNEDLRANLNYEIQKELKKSNKGLIKNLAEKHPDWVRGYINYIEKNQAEIKPYNLEIDNQNKYRNEKKAYEFIIANPIDNISVSNEQEFITFLELVIHKFKIFIEEKEGYELLCNTTDLPQHRNEFDTQSLLAEIILSYCQVNNISILQESEICKKVINFTFPEYQNSAFIKLKLAKNIRSRSKQDDLKEKLLANAKIQTATIHNYLLAIAYTKQEFKEIELISFDDIGFKFVIVNATLEKIAISEPSISQSIAISIPAISKEMNLPRQRKQKLHDASIDASSFSSILDFLQKIYDRLAILEEINDKLRELDNKVSNLDSISQMQNLNETSDLSFVKRFEEMAVENTTLRNALINIQYELEAYKKENAEKEKHIGDLVAEITSKYNSTKGSDEKSVLKQALDLVKEVQEVSGKTTNLINCSLSGINNLGDTKVEKQTGIKNEQPPSEQTIKNNVK